MNLLNELTVKLKKTVNKLLIVYYENKQPYELYIQSLLIICEHLRRHYKNPY